MSQTGKVPVLQGMRAIPFVVVALIHGLAIGCGGEVDAPGAPSANLQEWVGLSCELETSAAPDGLAVEESALCGEAVCLGQGEDDVYCSCRCSGPETEAPFCECPGGFRCEDDLIPDLGILDEYAGGYCVRND